MNLNMKAIDMGCIVLLVLVVVAGGFFFQLNFARHSSQLKLEKEQLLAQKKNLNLAFDELARLQSQFKEKEDRVIELNKRVPKAPQMGDLLGKLHVLVKKRNIILTDFNHRPAETFERYKRIPVNIIVNGGFLDIYRLIHDMETLNRVFILEKIVIKKQEENKLCQAILMASVFQQ